MGLADAAFSAVDWLRSRYYPAKAADVCSLPFDKDVEDLAAGLHGLSLHGSTAPLPKPARGKAKGKKSVAFALERNETRSVDYWFVETWGDGYHRYTGHVKFARIFTWIEYPRWIEPHGHTQLHFPRTKYVRDVPDWQDEDGDGDIAMLA